MEDYYYSSENFPQVIYNKEFPQSACVILDPNGKILGLVGGIGEKTVSRGFNRASMAKRHPGSSIKPIGTYALAFDYDRITWSTLVDDNPIDPAKNWPLNFDRIYRGPVTIDYAVQMSVNTVAVKVCDMMSEKLVFDFMKNSLHMDNLVERRGGFTDVGLAPMALGSLTDGLTPLEMAGGYQMFGNGGYYTEPYAFTRVVDSNGKTVLEADTTPVRVIGEDTAAVMTKLLQRVTTGPSGTGRSANLANMPTAGKTGTSSDDVDQWFIGFTPYYICQVWLGYDEKTADNRMGSISYSRYPPPLIFNEIMTQLHEGLERKEFIESPNVVSKTYCTVTGNLASSICTSTGSGWYKASHLPPTCTGHPVIEESVPDEDDSSGDSAAGRPISVPPVKKNWDEQDS